MIKTLSHVEACDLLDAACGGDLKREPDDLEGLRMGHYRPGDLEVPVVENLDSKLLDQIHADRRSFDMASWHLDATGRDIGPEDINELQACGTTHCRAGWAVVLGGKAGLELEHRVGPELAGALIYVVSTGRLPHFFADNAVAYEDIKRCAAVGPLERMPDSVDHLFVGAKAPKEHA